MNWRALSNLSPKKIKELQDKKLRAFVRYQIWPYHPYYRRLFRKKNIDPYSIKTTDDLTKLPFTSKDDIAPTEKNIKRPFEFVLQPSEELVKQHMPKHKLLKFNIRKELETEYKPVHMHFTTGRTSLPVPFLYSACDIEKLKEAGRRMFDVFNIKPDSKVINGFPYAPHLAFWQTYHAIMANNMLSLHTGGGKVLGTEKIIESIEKMRANTIVFMPGYAYHLIREAAEKKSNFSSVNELIFGGERASPGLKDKIKGLLAKLKCKSPRLLGTYALTEGKVAWAECCENSGYHLYPDMEFIEIIEKDGERAEESQRGEIVYTALDFRGSVVLRYRTGDMSTLIYEKCGHCGKTVPRVDPNIERISEFRKFSLTKVKGTLINLNFFFPFLMGHKDIEEWQVAIKKRRNDPYEVDELIIYIAPKKKVSAAKLKAELKHRIRDEIEVTPQIIITAKEDLLEKLGMETELKEKRIIDLRKK